MHRVLQEPENLGWLRARWQALVRPLSSNPAAADATWEGLVLHYSEPHRAYHNLSHIMALLRQAEAERVHIKRQEVVEFAIWFHDVIYDTHAHDNEQRSAEWTHHALQVMGIGSHIIAPVEQCILATQKHEVSAPQIADLPLFLDMDMSILGAPHEIYRQYSQLIRAEYSWVPEPRYRSERAEILKRFINRPTLFFTPMMAARFEARARHNVERELQELSSS